LEFSLLKLAFTWDNVFQSLFGKEKIAIGFSKIMDEFAKIAEN